MSSQEIVSGRPFSVEPGAGEIVPRLTERASWTATKTPAATARTTTASAGQSQRRRLDGRPPRPGTMPPM